jgi:hypothetical protein
MKSVKSFAIVVVVAAAAAAAWAATRPQDAMPGPTPEHKLLERWAGTWECEMEASAGADVPPEKSKAKSTSRLACGGMWLITDFEGTVAGAPFEGHEVAGFDPKAKKYLLTWVDAWSPGFTTGEGTWDEKTKTLAMSVHGVSWEGKPETWRQTDVWKDADTHEWTMLRAGPDGKEAAALRIVYRRKK